MNLTGAAWEVNPRDTKSALFGRDDGSPSRDDGRASSPRLSASLNDPTCVPNDDVQSLGSPEWRSRKEIREKTPRPMLRGPVLPWREAHQRAVDSFESAS